MNIRELLISDHALLQFIKRTGAYVSKQNTIKAMVAFGQEVEPRKEAARFHKVLRHKKHARYFLRGNWMAVIVDSNVVTVYETKPDRWRPVE